MTRLSLALLGTFQATLDGEPLRDFESDKARAFLAYLAVEADQPHRRETLAALLWPDVAESTARANLRRVLSNVRQVIGDRDSETPFLLVTRQSIQFDEERDLWLDVAEFVRGVAGEPGRSPAVHELEEAVTLYHGPFLAGFSLPDSAPFEEWMRLKAEALQQQVTAALRRLARHYESERDYASALRHARRLLELDPYAEAAHRQMMRLLALSGQRSDALAQYDACRQLLADELGVDPAEETQALAERIRSGDFSPDSLPGTGSRDIRGYELREYLGRGSFGSVYRAYQPVIGRDVAVKVILPQYANQPDFIRRFEVEAQLVARLEHPHIVPLYDYWREPDGAFLVMRWLRAGSLRDALRRGPWHPKMAVRLVDQIAAALAAAHRRGVVHRDVKPGNILLDEENNAYLSDFGIARLDEPLTKSLIGDERAALLADEAATDTAEYVSPERIEGAAGTPRADIYSLGVVLYELLAGRHPFPNLSVAALLERHLHTPLPPVTAVRPDLPAAVDDVIQTATAKDPDDRYTDALLLAEAFRQALRSETTPALTTPVGDAIQNPYVGLRPFQEADADNFFGRDALAEALVERLRDGRFLALVGPSGSGKSSVVKAGLIPALRDGALPASEKWFVTQMAPGAQPLEELESALLRVAVNPPALRHGRRLLAQLQADTRGLLHAVNRALPHEEDEQQPEHPPELLLVIDHFEELFVQTTDETKRNFFLDTLWTAVTDPQSRLRLVIILRADFYDRPLHHAEFGRLLRAHQETVLPLTAEELSAAIVGPARRAGLTLEPELAPAMIADLHRQPGALPLLQYALTELVEQRTDNTLALADYTKMGGVAGALGRRAESLFANLDEAEQDLARRLFLRLVTLGENEDVTRRRAPYAQLLSLAPQSEAAARVIERYGHYRLLTFDHDPVTRTPTVELAHEALLWAWPRLRQWLDDARADLRRRRHLAHATAEWQQADRDPGYLLRGARLDQFVDWPRPAHLALTPSEQTFLDASLAARRERESLEAARRRREAALERRSRRRLQALVGVLLLATLVAVSLVIFAFDRSRAAQAEARQAAARELAAVAVGNLDVDPERSVLLAMHAVSETVAAGEAAVPQAVDALHQAVARLRVQHTYSDTGSSACFGVFWCSSVAYSSDGELLVTSGTGGGAVVWEAATGRRVLALSGHEGPVVAVAVHPQGTHIATASADGTAALWPLARLLDDGERESTAPTITFTGHLSEVVDVAFSADGARLATASRDRTARVWDTATGELLQTFSGHEESVRDVLFTAAGDFLVTGSSDMTARVWNLSTGEAIAVLSGHTDRIFDVTLSPDEQLLATASRDGTVKAWNLTWEGDAVSATEQMAVVNGNQHGGPVYAAAFAPGGRLLATGGDDATAQVWDVDTGQRLLTLAGHNSTVVNLAFSPDGSTLATGSLDGTVRTWDVTPEGGREWLTLAGHRDVSFDVRFSPDGGRLATASFDGTAALWDVRDGQQLRSLMISPAPVSAAVFSPDGQRLATSSFDGTAVLWNPANGERVRVLEGHQGPVTDVAFHGDGHLLATAGADGTVRLWDAANGDETQLFARHERGVERVTFSPDGHFLASAGVDGTVRIFNLENDTQIAALAAHEGGVLGLAFNADGDRLATTGSDGLAKVWDTAGMANATEAAPADLPLLLTLSGHQSRVWGAAFSPDGRRLATISADGFVKLWDVTGAAGAAPRNRELLSLGPGNDGRDVAFSPDGRFLAATSGAGLVRIYLTSTSELMALAKSRVTRSLTPAECRQYLHLSACPPVP